MLDEQFESALQQRRKAASEREQALTYISDMCQNGHRDQVMRWLIPEMRRTPSLKKIRLWQLDAMMFGTIQYRAVNTVRKMRELIGDQSHVKDGHCSLGWALQNREATVRMTTWLWLLLDRERLIPEGFKPPEGLPYKQLFEEQPN